MLSSIFIWYSFPIYSLNKVFKLHVKCIYSYVAGVHPPHDFCVIIPRAVGTGSWGAKPLYLVLNGATSWSMYVQNQSEGIEESREGAEYTQIFLLCLQGTLPSTFPTRGGPGQQRQHWHTPSSKRSARGMQIQPCCGGFRDFDSLTVKVRNDPGPWRAQGVWVSGSSEGVKLPDGSWVRKGRWVVLSSDTRSPGDTKLAVSSWQSRQISPPGLAWFI